MTQSAHPSPLPTLHADDYIIELERIILGSLLVEGAKTRGFCAQIKSERWFYNNAHQIIFAAIQELLAEGVDRPDIIIVAGKLRAAGQLDLIGGAWYLAELTSRIGSTANLPRHIAGLIEEAIRRTLHHIGHLLAQSVEKPTTDVFDEMKALTDSIDKIRKDFMPVVDATADEELDKLIPLWQERRQRVIGPWEDSSGISTGLTQLDALTGGLQNGEMIVVAAATSMGKTSLAVQFGLSAMFQNIQVGFFSMEMVARKLTIRLLSQAASVPVHVLGKGAPTDDEMQRLTSLPRELMRNAIIVDATGMNVAQLQSECKRLVDDHGVGLLILDYLQLMDSGERSGMRSEDVSKISRAVKNIAVKHNVPFVALSQLNRSVAAEQPPIPKLNHLRESGAIENDADTVLMLWRPEYYNLHEFPNGGSTAGVANLIIAKQRDGPTGAIALAWEAQYSRFADLPGDHRDYIYPS